MWVEVFVVVIQCCVLVLELYLVIVFCSSCFCRVGECQLLFMRNVMLLFFVLVVVCCSVVRRVGLRLLIVIWFMLKMVGWLLLWIILLVLFGVMIVLLICLDGVGGVVGDVFFWMVLVDVVVSDCCMVNVMIMVEMSVVSMMVMWCWWCCEEWGMVWVFMFLVKKVVGCEGVCVFLYVFDMLRCVGLLLCVC